MPGLDQSVPTPSATPASVAASRVSTESILLQSIVSAGRLARRESRPGMIASQALDWPGVLVEAGKNDVAAVDDVVGDQHYLSLNVDSTPLTLEIKEPDGFKQYTVPPQTIWVSPSANPVTLRLKSTLSYLRVSIDPLYLGRLTSRSPEDVQPVRLRRTYAIASPQIVHLMMALRHEADGRNPGGLAVVEAVTTALGHLLVRHAGVEQPRPHRVRGGLSATDKRRVLELIDAQLDARLSIQMLAHEAGLSPAHFARAFKETMGRAPHQFLLQLRLERARRLLELPGASLSDIAQRTGFADQAHLTRLFKRAYGVTPGALVRRRGEH
ncbi:MAG: helix-turn-helix domain-containing protein [Gemmatimonadales bacterium]